MTNIALDHLASLSGNGLYSYIANSQKSKPFHDFVEKSIKNIIGDFKNPYMDAVSGKWHRWKHGHDPLDILRQVGKDPLGRGKLDAGHFITDLFTKDGVPLPGMSKDYLGSSIINTLKSLGVEKPIKWLNINGFDYLFGGLSLAESTHDLSQALSSEAIDFTWETALDTFGEGTLEIYFGLQNSNVLLLSSAVTEFISGSIMLYKDITRVESTIYEQLLDNIPAQAEIASALGFYMMVSSLKNYILYSRGNITGKNFTTNTLIDISTSLGSFAITKSLITTLSIGVTSGGMLLPILIGGGSSLLLRHVFKIAFPYNPILINENELWEQSPFQFNSPWNKNSFNNSNVWQQNIFDNGNVWQQNIFKK